MLHIRESFYTQNTYRLKLKVFEEIVCANVGQESRGVYVYVSSKIDFMSEIVTRNKEKHYIVRKKLVQKKTSQFKLYRHQVKKRPPKYIKQALTEQKRYKSV